ncbi:MAG: YicC/YloC family endoribonuclease [Acidobacteriota bacterium]
MRSMTGFGQASAESSELRVQVTVRTVNHRYLDLVLRLRDDVRPVEKKLREAFTAQLERGRVEVSMEIERLSETPVRLASQPGLAQGVRDLLDELASGGLEIRQPSLSDILRLPDAVRFDQVDGSLREEDLDLILGACERAVEQVARSRTTEGESLRQALESRLAGLQEIQQTMVGQAAGLPAQMAQALEERLEELLGDRGGVDADRVAQEVAHLADRIDVSEELDRLASHLSHFTELLTSSGSVGKRMDFLAQEVFRELNTIGSKCRDSELVRSVLDAKVLCEQVREQVQNVE